MYPRRAVSAADAAAAAGPAYDVASCAEGESEGDVAPSAEGEDEGDVAASADTSVNVAASSATDPVAGSAAAAADAADVVGPDIFPTPRYAGRASSLYEEQNNERPDIA